MCTTINSVNPKIKGQSGDFAVARNDLQHAFYLLFLQEQLKDHHHHGKGC
jgi:hypothetical protein